MKYSKPKLMATTTRPGGSQENVRGNCNGGALPGGYICFPTGSGE